MTASITAGATRDDLDRQPPLLPLRDAAPWLGISPDAARRGRREGRLPVPAIRVGRGWSVRRDDLARVVFGDD